MLLLASTTKALEFHSLDYFTVLFVSCDSVRVDGNINNQFFLLRERESFKKRYSNVDHANLVRTVT